jgi:hypothetical protein
MLEISLTVQIPMLNNFINTKDALLTIRFYLET